jgi:hypothetical protein
MTSIDPGSTGERGDGSTGGDELSPSLWHELSHGHAEHRFRAARTP